MIVNLFTIVSYQIKIQVSLYQNIKFFAMGTEMVLYDSEQLEEILHKSYHILYYGMKQNNHFLTCYR